MLQRRGNVYTSRVSLPVRLKRLLGRAEITRSLRTHDRREAMRRLRVWEAHIDCLLSIVSRQGASMKREELDLLVEQYTTKTFDEIEDTLALEWSEGGLYEYGFQLSERAEALAAALANANPEGAFELARTMAPGASEELLRVLARRLIEAQLRGIKAELAALSGEPLERPVAAPRRTQTVVPESKASRTLSELVAEYADGRVASKSWTSRTEIQVRGYLHFLTEMLGDQPVSAVKKEHLRQLGLDLTRMPASSTKRFRGMTPRQALQAAGEDEAVPRLAPNSVNAYYQAIRSFFNWAVDHDHIERSPATVLKDMKTGRASDDRLPFDDEDLIRYFAHLDAKKGLQKFEYWIPRIMAYSGCRLGEAAQLRAEDIRQERGVWVFDINEDVPGKRLKTDASRRQVPIHPRLLELGLTDFVASMPAGFLWPADMRTASGPSVSAVDKLQKRLAYVLRGAGVADSRKTASHSFRHTVSARLKALSTPEYQISEILGHEQDSMSTGRYGTTTDVVTLHAVISKLSLPI